MFLMASSISHSFLYKLDQTLNTLLNCKEILDVCNKLTTPMNNTLSLNPQGTLQQDHTSMRI